MKQLVITFLALNLLVFATCAQTRPPLDSRLIDQYVGDEIARWKVPGCAIAIVDGKKVIYAQGYGFRNVEEKLPVTPNTVFKIASCTKSFTAAAAAILVGKKLVDWDEPVSNYLPRLKFSDRLLNEQVSLRDILSHRTGLYDDDWSWVGDHVDSLRLYEILAAMPRKAPFRSSFIYSNICYGLAGLLVTSRSQTSWRENMRKDFFEPLSMNSTCFSHTEASGLTDFAFGYESVDSAGHYVRGNLSEHCTDSLSAAEPFGFISTSALDLSKWLQLFINGGKWEGKSLIPPDAFRELIKPRNFISFSPYKELTEDYYCMGWIQSYYKSLRLLQHSGGLMGFKCYMSFMPNDSIGVVVLTNGQHNRFAEAMSYDLYDIVLGLGRTHWLKRWKEEEDSRPKPKKEAAVPATALTRPAAEYAGTYHSHWIGDMKIFHENGNLYFQFHNYPKELMKHEEKESFSTESGKILFRVDARGKVSGMMLNEFEFYRKE